MNVFCYWRKMATVNFVVGEEHVLLQVMKIMRVDHSQSHETVLWDTACTGRFVRSQHEEQMQFPYKQKRLRVTTLVGKIQDMDSWKIKMEWSKIWIRSRMITVRNWPSFSSNSRRHTCKQCPSHSGGMFPLEAKKDATRLFFIYSCAVSPLLSHDLSLKAASVSR